MRIQHLSCSLACTFVAEGHGRHVCPRVPERHVEIPMVGIAVLRRDERLSASRDSLVHFHQADMGSVWKFAEA